MSEMSTEREMSPAQRRRWRDIARSLFRARAKPRWRMSWLELAIDEADKVGVSLSADEASVLLFDHSDYPNVEHGNIEHADACRQQMREAVLASLARVEGLL